MTAAGIPTQVNSVWGQSNLASITASGYALYNTAVSVGGGDNADWSLASTNPVVAGGYPFGTQMAAPADIIMRAQPLASLLRMPSTLSRFTIPARRNF